MFTMRAVVLSTSFRIDTIPYVNILMFNDVLMRYVYFIV